MIIDQIGSVFEYKGIVYTIGGKVYANDESIYSGLYGRIAEIRTDADQIEDRTDLKFCVNLFPLSFQMRFNGWKKPFPNNMERI